MLFLVLLLATHALCPSGSDNATGVCTPCPIGFSSPGGGHRCEPCLPGHCTAVPGESACLACPAGRYANGFGSGHCPMCPKGLVSPEGWGACTSACPPLTEAAYGSAACEPVEQLQPDLNDAPRDLRMRRYTLSCSVGMQDSCLHEAIAAHGYIWHNLRLQNMLAVEFTIEEVEALVYQSSTLVAFELDPPRYPLPRTAQTKLNLADGLNLMSVQSVPYGIEMVEAPQAWADFGVTGEGTKVCVMDTGIFLEHPDLNPAAISGETQSPSTVWHDDGHGHGTHVAGTIAAQDNDRGVVGVAPGASLVIERVFDSGGIWSSDLVEAANRCADQGARVISMSLGGSMPNLAEMGVFQTLRNQGVLNVAAAGNTASYSLQYPAAYGSVLSVGAVGSNKLAAWFTTRNEFVDLTAPGMGVVSTWKNGGYYSLDGTSMATPHVSGVAALLWDLYPQATVTQVSSAMLDTAEDLGQPGRDQVFGNGLVSARRACAALTMVLGETSTTTTTSTAAPTTTTTTTSTPATTTTSAPGTTTTSSTTTSVPTSTTTTTTTTTTTPVPPPVGCSAGYRPTSAPVAMAVPMLLNLPAEACTACAPGTHSPSGDACQTCEIGHVAPAQASSECTACVPPLAALDATLPCGPCPQGSSGCSFLLGEGVGAVCMQCLLPGHCTLTTDTIPVCVPQPSDYYLLAVEPHPGGQVCAPCSSAPANGTECDQAPVVTTTTTQEPPSASTTAPPPPACCPEGTLDPTCVPCAPGTQSVGLPCSRVCRACPVGTHQPLGGQTTCPACPDNTIVVGYTGHACDGSLGVKTVPTVPWSWLLCGLLVWSFQT